MPVPGVVEVAGQVAGEDYSDSFVYILVIIFDLPRSIDRRGHESNASQHGSDLDFLCKFVVAHLVLQIEEGWLHAN